MLGPRGFPLQAFVGLPANLNLLTGSIVEGLAEPDPVLGSHRGEGLVQGVVVGDPPDESLKPELGSGSELNTRLGC